MQKCLTCSNSARGQERVIRRDGVHLDGCGCPIRTSALHLWLLKVTANDIEMDDNSDHCFKLKPSVLRLVEAGIEVASGHSVDTLLQPEIPRLEWTINWALGRLADVVPSSEGNRHRVEAVKAEFRKVMKELMGNDDDSMVE